MSRRTDIVNHLQDRGFQSVSALAQAFGVDASTIRRDLDKLEAEGIVERTVIPETPVRVEYALTKKGRALAPAMDAIVDWAHKWTADQPAPAKVTRR